MLNSSRVRDCRMLLLQLKLVSALKIRQLQKLFSAIWPVSVEKGMRYAQTVSVLLI